MIPSSLPPSLLPSPPPLLPASHQVFGGKALDIWAAGITLYCLIYGKVRELMALYMFK